MERLSHITRTVVLAGLMPVAALAASGVQQGAPAGGASASQVSLPAQAFEHYEAIRTALSADSVAGVAEHAAALGPLAAQLAGSDAAAAVDKLAKARTIADARTHFGDVSTALVPKFLEAKLPDVQGFTCAMKKKSWAQKGAKAQNPYYGKSMASCGTAIEKK